MRPSLIAVATALTLSLTGCSIPRQTADATEPGFGEQICATSQDDHPGYPYTAVTTPSPVKRLSGAGSSFVGPVMSIWAKEYARAFGVRVAYQPIGSGGGVAQVIAGTVDFGASDTPMTATESARSKNRTVLHIPVVLGAVVPAYHLQGIGSGLRFDGGLLGRIYTGAVRRWNDPLLQRLNPEVRLPDTPIVVVHRSDASGTTAVWTDFLTRTSPSWRAAFASGTGSGKQVVWPVGMAGKGNDGVAGMLAQVDGAIGYLELSYALAQGVHYGRVQNRAGRYIQPCPATVTRATEGVEYPADLRIALTDGPDPNAYPIAGATFVLIFAEQSDPARAGALAQLLAWVLTAGQDLVAALGYAPLGTDLHRRAYGQLRAMSVNGSHIVATGAPRPIRAAVPGEPAHEASR